MANFRRSGVAAIEPSKSLLRCLPAATTADSSTTLRSRGMVPESKIVTGMKISSHLAEHPHPHAGGCGDGQRAAGAGAAGIPALNEIGRRSVSA